MTFPSGNRNWLAPLATAILVAAFGLWCSSRVRQTIEDQLEAELQTILDANVTALEIWTTNQFNLATTLLGDPAIRQAAIDLLSNTNPPDNTPDADAPPAQGRFPGAGRPPPGRTTLDRLLRPRLSQIGYRVAHVVDTNLAIVAGFNRGRGIGRSQVLEEHVARYSELFESGEPILITPFKLRRPTGPGGPPRRPNGIGTSTDPANRRAWMPWNRRPPTDNSAPRPPLPNAPGNPPSPGPGSARPATHTNNNTNAPPSRPASPALMQVAVPVRDDDGRILGAFALVIDPEREFTRILSVARSGMSGETYALDQRGLLISRSRFDNQLRRLGLIPGSTDASSALNLRLSDPGADNPAAISPDDPANPSRPLTHLAAGAVAGTSGVDVTPSRDYRGVPVVGAWRWLPEHAFGVVTQINATEAYRPLRVLNSLFLILFLLLLLCSTGMLLVSAAGLAWRRRLDEAELRLRQLGQYVLEEKIGEGAMGVVYRARHGLMRRDTAVKLLLPDRASPEAVQRFEREVCLSCRLSHPNTIQVFDYGRTPDGIFYYAMEFLRGLNLHDLVERYGPQPEARVIHILLQICESLGEAHALGLVHRDVKPGNVMLCHRGGIPDCVKVLDFGLIQEFKPDDHAPPPDSAMIEGTPSFIPPEAIHNRNPIGPRSDLYSVGALGYYLISGQTVFEASDLADLYRHHLHIPPVPPSRRTTNRISPDLERLLLECLAKDPADRPPTAESIARRLEALPDARAWDPVARAAWWSAHPEAAVPSPASAKPSSQRSPMPTLRVDLADRTLPPA